MMCILSAARSIAPIFPLIIAATIHSVGFAGTHSATLSSSDLRRKVLDGIQQVTCISVEYRAESLIDNKDGNYVHREIMMKSPTWMFHRGAHGSAKCSWRDDIEQQEAWIGVDRYFNEFPLQRRYFFGELKPTAPFPGTLQTEIFFPLTGLWLTPARPPKRLWNLVPDLKSVAESEKYSTVRGELESIEGHWCHVLEHKGVEALWLDSERGCCVMKRIAFEPGTSQEFGNLALTDHREILPGFWMAFKIRDRQFAYIDGKPRVVMDYHLNVLEANCDDISANKFEFRRKPGSMSAPAVYAKGPMKQTEPGGLDYLDNVVDWAQRVVVNNVELRPHRGRIATSTPMICTALLIVILETRRWLKTTNSN